MLESFGLIGLKEKNKPSCIGQRLVSQDGSYNKK